MNRRVVWAVARKDIGAIRDNIQAWLPMIIVPLVLGVILPGTLIAALTYGSVEAAGDLERILSWIEELPAFPLRERLAALPVLEQRLAYLAAALLPATGLSLLTLAMAALTVNAVAWPLFGAVFFPDRSWLPLILLVMPAVSLLAVLINVFISARVRTFQAAFQLGAMIVLPVVGVTAAQAAGVLILNQRTATLLGVAVLLIDVLLLRRFRTFLDRPRLFESQVR